MQNILLQNDPSSPYANDTLKKKYEIKEKIQQQLWLKVGKKTFIAWTCMAITTKNHAKELISSMEGLLEVGVQFVVLAKSEAKYQKPMEDLMQKYPWSITALEEGEASERLIYSVSDVCLFLENDENKIASSLSYACVPVCKKWSDIVKNFDPLLEKWNWFNLNWDTHWHIFEWIIRAKETFRFPYDWETLKKQCVA